MSQHAPPDPFGNISIARPDDQDLRKALSKKQRPATSQPPFPRKGLPPKKRRSPWPAIVALIGLGAVSYLVGGALAVPYLVKSVAARALAKHLDRPVTIGQVEFDPFTLRLSLVNGIIGPRLSDPDDKIDPILSFSALTLDLEVLSLPRWAIICRELSLSQPFVHVVHGRSHDYNLATLLPLPSGPEASRLGPSPLGGLSALLAKRYSINNIAISDGEILVDDLPSAKVHHVEKVNISLPAIASINYQDGRITPHFSAVVNGTPLEMSGQAQLTKGPMTSRLNLKMTDLDLAAYQEYLPPRLAIETLSGQADLDLELLYSAAEPPAERLRISGAIGLRTAQVNGAHGLVSVDSGQVKGWLTPFAQQFQVHEITLQHPVWQRLPGQGSPWPVLAGSLLRLGADTRQSLALNLLRITKGEIRTPLSANLEQAADWQAIDTSITPGKEGDQGQTFFALSAQNANGCRISLQGSAQPTPFVATGLLVIKQVDIAASQDLWQTIGPALPVKSGRIEQLQSNFSLAMAPDLPPILRLDPLSIQAKDLLIEQNGQTLSMPIWQSEQGSFRSDDKTLHLGKVSLQQPKIICRRQSSTGTWQTIASHPDGQATPPPPFDLSGLDLANASLLIENLGPPDITLKLERFDLQVEQLDPRQPSSLTGAAMLDDKYPIQTTGTFTWSPFSASLNIQASDLPLALFQPVLERYFASPLNGALSIDGTLSLPSLDYRGQWAVNSLSAPPISCRRLSGEGTTFILRPLALSLERLRLEEPALHITANANGMPQLPTIMKPGWQPAPTAQTATVAIKAIDLADAQLIYDLPAPPELCPAPPCGGLTLGGQKISGSIEDFIVAKDQAIPFTINGLLETSAEFKAHGAISPFASPPKLTLNHQITGLPLIALAPLLEPYWGFTIKDGTLDLANQLTYADTLIQDNSQLTLHGLSFGPPLAIPAIKAIGNTWQSLPLVQALLQDAATSITLTVPVDGRTDTGFTYQAGLRNYLNQLLLKATVSPMNLLADHTKSLSDQVEFQPGSHHLSKAEEEHLQDLATLLLDRPRLAVSLGGFADSVADAQAMLNRKTGTAQPPALGQGPVSPEALLALASKRGLAVQNYLTSHDVPLKQVRLTQPEVITSAKTGRAGRQVAIGLSTVE